jgi:hypothetical protein
MPVDDIFAWGSPGLMSPVKSEEIIDLVKIRIDAGQYFHSCLGYGDQFDYLKKASVEMGKPISLIAKVYLDFPVFSSPRRAPLLSQLESIYRYFDGHFKDLVIQISAVPFGFHERRESVITFLRRAYYDYGVTKIFVETFPAGENDSRNVIELLSMAINTLELDGKVSLGFTSYDGIAVQGFTDELLQYMSDNKIYYMPMKVMAGGTNSSQTRDFDLASEKVLEDAKYKYFFRAVTGTTKIRHYEQNSVATSAATEVRSRPFLKAYKTQPRNEAVNSYGIIYNREYGFPRIVKGTRQWLLNVLSLLKHGKSLQFISRQGFC